MENWLVWLLKQEVIIYKAEWLVHYPRRRKLNASFINNNFQVLSKNSLHYWEPYVHHNFFYTSRQFLEAMR
jgi:hypothetical protein